MQRLSLVFGSLVLSTLFLGCGGSGGMGGGGANAVPQSQNPDLPDEVRAEFKREEDMAKKAADRSAKSANH